jgi:tRNA threonylcarbamoyladenosine biosynthesis protein TsaE
LVHVDAYRLGGIDELDDLDLDASLDEAVTVAPGSRCASPAPPSRPATASSTRGP